MKIADKLRAISTATSWNQQQLAERFEVSQSTVNRWLRGSEPEGHRRDAINFTFNDVVSRQEPDGVEFVVPVMGYIGAGAEVEPDHEQVPPEGLEQVSLPIPLPADMIAFVVRGDSMLPVYKDGYVVIVYRDQKKPLEAFYGEDAAVRTSDGKRFIKTIMRGASGVTLTSWNSAPMENVRLEWVGEIFASMPRSALRTASRVGGIQGQLRLKSA